MHGHSLATLRTLIATLRTLIATLIGTATSQRLATRCPLGLGA